MVQGSGGESLPKVRKLMNNGTLRTVLTGGVIVLALTAVFWMGVTWATVNGHIQDQGVHQTVQEKQFLIDERIEMHMREINLRLENIEKDVQQIREEIRDD